MARRRPPQQPGLKLLDAAGNTHLREWRSRALTTNWTTAVARGGISDSAGAPRRTTVEAAARSELAVAAGSGGTGVVENSRLDLVPLPARTPQPRMTATASSIRATNHPPAAL
jgi:hypothetical protein